METFIVGAIIVAAAGYTVYRLISRPSCGCGSGCACSGKIKAKENNCGQNNCNCGK